jgi:hypothetical protein
LEKYPENTIFPKRFLFCFPAGLIRSWLMGFLSLPSEACPKWVAGGNPQNLFKTLLFTKINARFNEVFGQAWGTVLDGASG